MVENAPSSERDTAEPWVLVVIKRGLGRGGGKPGVTGTGWALRARVVVRFDDRR